MTNKIFDFTAAVDAREKALNAGDPRTEYGKCMADNAKLRALVAELVDAAGKFLYKIDHITTEEFEHGGERAERETLRAVLRQHQARA